MRADVGYTPLKVPISKLLVLFFSHQTNREDIQDTDMTSSISQENTSILSERGEETDGKAFLRWKVNSQMVNRNIQ